MGSQLSSLSVWFAVALAVFCNAGAQVLIKRASSVPESSASSMIFFGFNVLTLASAVALYALSFLITAWVYARMPLSVASPLMAGAIFVLISIASVLWFSEAITVMRLGGMSLIVLGVLLLARSA